MRILTLALSLILIPVMLFAAEQKITLKVSGNCGSCKKRIVKAAETLPSVEDAAWDKKTKIFTAEYDDTKTTPEAIKQAILKVGYDVEGVTADQEAYSKLPDCCKYKDQTHD
ncbi:MAG: heavy-metal-associated domain-containing protein [Candidatus Kapabacteria bacterium]|nr:heavy-metal-associated domain-containing protein [Candidatus Kapabacteria bacterium]